MPPKKAWPKYIEEISYRFQYYGIIVSGLGEQVSLANHMGSRGT